MIAILPCPFCGREPKAERRADYYAIWCSYPDCCNPSAKRSRRGDAVKKWNKRAPIKSVEGTVSDD